MHSHVDTYEQFDLASFEVDSGYFKEQIGRYEEQYRAEYPHGWGQFFAAYSNGETDKGNLDYDEWAFLCEHFMRQSWTPPANLRAECNGKPETNSGFFFVGAKYCSILTRTSPDFPGSSANATHGKTLNRQPLAFFVTPSADGKLLRGGIPVASYPANC